MRHDEIDGLPTELAEGLERLATTGTRDSQPFPGVKTAIRRRRNRSMRAGGVALAVAVAATVVGVEALTGESPEPQAPAAPAPSASPTPQATPEPVETKSFSTPEEAGYSAKTAGSLADDEAWLSGFKEHVRSSQAAIGAPAIDPKSMQVLAAGDAGENGRYAVVLYADQGEGKQHWNRQFFLGPVDARPDQMFDTVTDLEPKPGLITPESISVVQSAIDGGPGESYLKEGLNNAVAVVSAPLADEVRITTGRKFTSTADGPSATTTDRALPQIAPGLWAGPVNENEYFMAGISIMADGQVIDDRTPFSLTPGYQNLGDVAAPGTEVEDLDRLSGSLTEAGMNPTLQDEPVYAATLPIGKKHQVAALLLRTPEGAHVAAFAEDETTAKAYQVWHGHDVSPAGVETGDVLAGTYVDHAKVRRYLLLAPENATQVRVSGVTAAVENRLAVVEVPLGKADDRAQAEALDANGKVLTQSRPPAFSGGPYEKEPEYLEVPGLHRDGIVNP